MILYIHIPCYSIQPIVVYHFLPTEKAYWFSGEQEDKSTGQTMKKPYTYAIWVYHITNMYT